MEGDLIRAKVLCAQRLPNADPVLRQQFDVPEGHLSLGIFTTDSDDVGYTALDEATKKANVAVVYARSMYAGAGNASTALTGEFIGILSAPTPSEITSGLEAAKAYVEEKAAFCSANAEDSVVYFAHCIASTGQYLSKEAGVAEGTAMAYLIAPPMEAIMGLDGALKAADVTLRKFYGPPTETNFAGALLTGDQAACQEACQAFARVVCQVAQTPISY